MLLSVEVHLPFHSSPSPLSREKLDLSSPLPLEVLVRLRTVSQMALGCATVLKIFYDTNGTKVSSLKNTKLVTLGNSFS